MLAPKAIILANSVLLPSTITSVLAVTYLAQLAPLFSDVPSLSELWLPTTVALAVTLASWTYFYRNPEVSLTTPCLPAIYLAPVFTDLSASFFYNNADTEPHTAATRMFTWIFLPCLCLTMGPMALSGLTIDETKQAQIDHEKGTYAPPRNWWRKIERVVAVTCVAFSVLWLINKAISPSKTFVEIFGNFLQSFSWFSSRRLLYYFLCFFLFHFSTKYSRGNLSWFVLSLAVYTLLLDPHMLHFNYGLGPSIQNWLLNRQGFTVLERQDTVSEYLSVLQNDREGYRLLRSDHSLLGGMWLPEALGGKEGKVPEPVFGAFAMMEAVRLMENKGSQPWQTYRASDERNALCIGLGVGTTPLSLITHNVNTTTIELNPKIPTLAQKHFRFPSPKTEPRLQMIQGNALEKVDGLNMPENPDLPGLTFHIRYDYIVHDVFTGGVEPLKLFSEEFLWKLQQRMKRDGVIAINYAGDLTLPTTAAVLNSIYNVFSPLTTFVPGASQEKFHRSFKNHTCRSYTDMPRSPPDANSEKQGELVNLITFCGPEGWEFRTPNEDDLMGSQIRAEFLLPRYEFEISGWDVEEVLPQAQDQVQDQVEEGEEGAPSDAELRKKARRSARFELPKPRQLFRTPRIRDEKDVEVYADEQRVAAGRHWRAMKGVLPERVWLLW